MRMTLLSRRSSKLKVHNIPRLRGELTLGGTLIKPSVFLLRHKRNWPRQTSTTILIRRKQNQSNRCQGSPTGLGFATKVGDNCHTRKYGYDSAAFAECVKTLAWPASVRHDARDSGHGHRLRETTIPDARAAWRRFRRALSISAPQARRASAAPPTTPLRPTASRSSWRPT